MRGNNSNVPWIRLALVGTLLLAGAASVGASIAHYMNEKNAAYTLRLQKELESGQIHLLSTATNEDAQLQYTPLSADNWEKGGNGGRLEFLLANGTGVGEGQWCQYDQKVDLSVFVTEGAGIADHMTVSIRSGGNEYVALPQRAEEGSSLYERYGAGWVFRFYDDAGEEVTWPISGRGFFYRTMVLNVFGVPDCSTAISLIAVGQPA